MHRPLARRLRALLRASLTGLSLVGLSFASPTARAADAEPASTWSALAPDTAFVQAGFARDTRATVIGAAWAWSWQRDFAGGRLGGYWEASFGRWNARQAEGDSSAWITQVGLTPVLRYTPADAGDSWFVEGGIGANLILPLYRSRDRRFSTTFNFGDHVALGWRFGEGRRHELALRIQHFSNAGIKRPNPGADFVQLRYSHAL